MEDVRVRTPRYPSTIAALSVGAPQLPDEVGVVVAVAGPHVAGEMVETEEATVIQVRRCHRVLEIDQAVASP